MYFSYEKGSLANTYALDAAEVREIIKMNRNGVRPESLKLEPEPELPEFVTAVGDDSITRFDNLGKKRKKKSKPQRKDGQPKKEAQPAAEAPQENRPKADNRPKGERNEGRRPDDRRRQGGQNRPRRQDGGRQKEAAPKE